MLNYILQMIPVLALLFAYFLRVEKQLTKLQTDINWIKKFLPQCQQPSDQNTP